MDALVDLYTKAGEQGYIMLADDYRAIGYWAMGCSDYRRVLFMVEQANAVVKFLGNGMYWQMAKYQDGSYGIR